MPRKISREGGTTLRRSFITYMKDGGAIEMLEGVEQSKLNGRWLTLPRQMVSEAIVPDTSGIFPYSLIAHVSARSGLPKSWCVSSAMSSKPAAL